MKLSFTWPSCSNSGLPQSTRAAGTDPLSRRHRSRVPRCGAGPPVWTGPPAPASRSPRAHRAGSLHGHAHWGAGFMANRPSRCPPPAALAAKWYGQQTTSCKARPSPSASPWPWSQLFLSPSLPWLFPSASLAGPPPPASPERTANRLSTSSAGHCFGVPRRTQRAKPLGLLPPWALCPRCETYTSCNRAFYLPISVTKR
jgi:hypothetical protein